MLQFAKSFGVDLDADGGSPPIDFREAEYGVIQFPSSINGATTVVIYVSYAEDGTYVALNNSSGNDLSIVPEASKAVSFSVDERIRGAAWVKLQPDEDIAGCYITIKS